MNTTKSEIAESKLYNELISGSGTLVLSRLNEIDSSSSTTPEVLEILKEAFQKEKDLILQFQIKKTLRLAIAKAKKINFKIEPNILEKLIRDPKKIDDLALAIISLDAVSGFLAADQLRAADWQNFKPEILPVICNFIKQYGGFEDVPTLLELTRYNNPIVVIAAIDALETIDPTNLQGIVEPLLDSPSRDMRVQAIQVYYKWNRKDAIDQFANMLFSENPKDRSLAIFHSEFFQFQDIESFLIKLLPHIDNKFDLMNLMRVFVKNADLDLPLKIYLVNSHLEGEQQGLIKGLLLSVIRELSKKTVIQSSIQDYLAELKERAKRITDEEAFLNGTKNEKDEITQNAIDINSLPADFTFVQEEQKNENIPTIELASQNNLQQFQIQAKETNTSQEKVQTTPKQEETQLNKQPKQETILDLIHEAVHELAPNISQNQEITTPKENIAPSQTLSAPVAPIDVNEQFPFFETLPEKKKIQLLARVNQEFYLSNYNKLKEYYKTAEGKVIASFISLFGKFGDIKEADHIRKLCSSKNQDVICACIKALSKLDTEYLCLYLPKYLQDENGKIRMTATRVCADIDPKRVENILVGMLTSPNAKQRTIGISTTMLVEFNIVKMPLLSALEKENNTQLMKKICMVLAANPDKDILYKVYKLSKIKKSTDPQLMQEILETISEKLSVLLNHSQTPEQLIKEAETTFKNETKNLREERFHKLQCSKEKKIINEQSYNSLQEIKQHKAEIIKEIRGTIANNSSKLNLKKQEENDIKFNSTFAGFIITMSGLVFCAGIICIVSGAALGLFNWLGFARYPIWLWILVAIADLIFKNDWASSMKIGVILLIIGLVFFFIGNAIEAIAAKNNTDQ